MSRVLTDQVLETMVRDALSRNFSRREYAIGWFENYCRAYDIHFDSKKVEQIVDEIYGVRNV